MAKFTRGFTGRGQGRTRSAPPTRASTTPDGSGRCSRPRSRPTIDPADWTFTVEGHVEQPTTWTWDEMHALPPSTYAGDIHCVTTWSKLGMEFEGVSVDTLLAAARPLADATHVLAFSSTGLHDEPPARRRHRRQGMGGVHRRRHAAVARSRRTRPLARAPPLLLEERQVGERAAGARPRRARVLGAQRLPRPRRPLARAALPGRLTRGRPRGRRRRCVAIRDETPRTQDVPPARSTRRPATAPGQHYVVRLTAPDGYTASRSYSVASAPDGVDEFELTVERLDDGEVSTLPPRRRRGRRRARGARTDRRLLRVGRRPRRRSSSAAAPASCRSWRCCASRARHRYAPTSSHLVVSVRSPDRPLLRRRAAGSRRDRRLPPVSADPASGRPAGAHHRRRRRRPPAAATRPSTCAGRRPFADTVGDLVTGLGVDPSRVRVERFGPSA